MIAGPARALATWLAVAMLAVAARAGDVVPEPEGYREDQFRAPVPATLEGGTVLDTEAAFALWRAGEAVFIDVLPRAPKPANLPAGTIWRDKPRMSIPGTIWLPNVGYGGLAPETDAYFRAGLDRATGGDKARPLVFFCLAECWMSWNAAKRAIREYGYRAVSWYPDGTDGWAFDAHPLEEVVPAEP